MYTLGTVKYIVLKTYERIAFVDEDKRNNYNKFTFDSTSLKLKTYWVSDQC